MTGVLLRCSRGSDFLFHLDACGRWASWRRVTQLPGHVIGCPGTATLPCCLQVCVWLVLTMGCELSNPEVQCAPSSVRHRWSCRHVPILSGRLEFGLVLRDSFTPLLPLPSWATLSLLGSCAEEPRAATFALSSLCSGYTVPNWAYVSRRQSLTTAWPLGSDRQPVPAGLFVWCSKV
jgi:hypothetical protein